MENNFIAIYGPAGSGKDYLSDCLRFFFESFTFVRNQFNKESEGKFGVQVPKISFIKIFYEFLEKRKPNKQYSKQIAFADPLKESLSKLFGIPLETFYDQSLKDSVYVNLTTFQTVDTNKFCLDQSDLILSDEELYKFKKDEHKFPEVQKCFELNNVYMSIRSLMNYYGTYVIRQVFYDEFFIKRTINSKAFDDYSNDDKLLIISDIRFPNEFKALKEQGAYIIEVQNPNNKKNVQGATEDHYDEFDPDYLFTNDFNELKFLMNFQRLFFFLFPEFENHCK